MTVKSGGEYDLNLKSSDLEKKEGGDGKKSLVDDGASISDKSSAAQVEAVDSIAKDISGSLRDFA